MAWKISVAHPVPDFSRGKNIKTTLSLDATAATSISTNKSDIFNYFREGDIVKIGPSSATGYEGKYEHVKINSTGNVSTNSSKLYFLSALTNNYLSSDAVEGIGSRIAEGWGNVVDTTSSEIWFWGNTPKLGYNGQTLDAYNSSYGATYVERVADGTSGTTYLKAYLKDKLLTHTPYRLGCYTLNSNMVGTGTAIELMRDVAGTQTLINVGTGGAYSTWTNLEGLLDGVTLTSQNDRFPSIWMSFAATTTFSYQAIDLLYLTHASLTSGEAAGVYTIPVNPIGVRKSTKDRNVKSKDINGSPIANSSFNLEPLRVFDIDFMDATADMVKQLEILSYWQGLGNLLYIEPDTDDRPFFGHLDFSFSYDQWDTTLLRLKLKLTGV